MNDKQKKKALSQHGKQPTRPKVVNEYLGVLNASHELVDKQSKTIKAGIALRIFNQDIIELLTAINTTGNLTATINNLTQLTREFDNLAMEYGPYDKGAYITTVVSRSTLGRDASG